MRQAIIDLRVPDRSRWPHVRTRKVRKQNSSTQGDIFGVATLRKVYKASYKDREIKPESFIYL